MKFTLILKLETLRRIQAWEARKITLVQRGDRNIDAEMLMSRQRLE